MRAESSSSTFDDEARYGHDTNVALAEPNAGFWSSRHEAAARYARNSTRWHTGSHRATSQFFSIDANAQHSTWLFSTPSG